jgi:hypothetical protein
MLEAFYPFGGNGYVKIFLRESFHIGVWGSNPQYFTEQEHSRNVVQFVEIKIIII